MRHADGGSSPGFGTLVRNYRHAAGLTQVELAGRAGISVAALRDFEQSRRRRPRPGTFTALVVALGLSQEQSAILGRAASLYRPLCPAIRPARGAAGPARTTVPPEFARGLWLTVLGPLEAWRDGMPILLGPPARRAVLGLLLMDPGVFVRRDTIIDVLWGETPPRTAVGLVQAHVSRIRRLLGPGQPGEDGDREAGGANMIASAGSAYRADPSRGEMDLLVFRNLAARAAASWANGGKEAAAEYYEQAIRLWHDEPLIDVEALYGHAGVAALRQELVDVLLRYAEVADAMGLHARVLTRLRALVRADPLNESAHARLMIALAGCGQRAAAIRVYEGVRLRLDRELGLYPGEELTGAYLRVLRQNTRAVQPADAAVAYSISQ